MQSPVLVSAYLVEGLLVGVLLIAGGLFLATHPRQVAQILHNYYSHLAQRKKGWPRWLAWQPVPNEGVSLVLAWLLITLMIALGISFIVLGLRGG